MQFQERKSAYAVERLESRLLLTGLQVVSHNTSSVGNQVTVDLTFNQPVNATTLNGLSVNFNRQGGTPTQQDSFGGDAYAIQTIGNKAYVANTYGGLYIYDVSNPSDARLLGKYDTSSSVQNIEVVGGITYVADSANGLLVLNTADPASISLMGAYDTPGTARSVRIVGATAYVLDGSQLQVLNVSNPALISLLGTYQLPNTAYAMAVAGDVAYVADGTSGLQILNIADPNAIVLLGTSPSRNGLYMSDIRIVGHHAYIVDDDGLQVLDVANPASIVVVGDHYTGGGKAIDIDGNRAYLADHSQGVYALDITNPSSITRLGRFDTPGFAYDVAVSNGFAFVADYDQGMQVLDVSDPTAITRVGGYPTPSLTYALAVSGNRAYVGDRYAGLQIIDISNPTGATRLGAYDTPGWPLAIQVIGDIAYVADGAMGLQVLDVSDPRAIALLGTYNTPGYAYDVKVVDNLAYIADGGGGVRILNVANPAVITSVGSSAAVSLGLEVRGKLVYSVGTVGKGLQILDVSNPAAPTQVGTYPDFSGDYLDVEIVGKVAYVAISAASLLALNVSNPGSISLLGRYYGANARHFRVSGGMAYLAAGSKDMVVLDISNPAAMALLSTCDTPFSAFDVQVVGDRAYFTDTSAGLQVFRVPQVAFDGTVTALGNNSYRLQQTLPDGFYTVTINAAVQDSTGSYLDQDGDDSPGEASDGYSISAFQVPAPPLQAAGEFILDAPKPSVKFTFNAQLDPLTVSASDLLLTNTTNGQVIDTAGLSTATYDSNTRSVTWSFAGLLLEGTYHASLGAESVADINGRVLDAEASTEFFVLPGDATRDRRVDTQDFNVLTANFGRNAPIFSEGDFNYDTVVDSVDFDLFVSQYGKRLLVSTINVPNAAPMFDSNPSCDERILSELTL